MKKLSKPAMVAAAILGGAITGALRSALDPSHPGSFYYIILFAFLALLALLGAARGRTKAPQTHKNPDSFKTAVVAAAMVLFLSAGLQIANIFGETTDIILACVLALALISAFGMIKGASGGTDEGTAVLSVVPVFFMCLFLLLIYKNHVATCPNRNIFATEMLAVLMMTMAVYSVCAMRFAGLSSSPFIASTILGGIYLTSLLAVSTVIRLQASPYVLTLPQMGVMVSMAIYSGAWYLFPPEKYQPPVEEEGQPSEGQSEGQTEGGEASPHFFDIESADPVIPDVDTIIEEVRSEKPGETEDKPESPDR